MHWWERVLVLLPFLLALSQVGYFGSKPFHALFGVALGLAIGAIAFYCNLNIARRRWRAPLEVAAMLAVPIGGFVSVVVIGLTLNAILPAGFFDR